MKRSEKEARCIVQIMVYLRGYLLKLISGSWMVFGWVGGKPNPYFAWLQYTKETKEEQTDDMYCNGHGSDESVKQLILDINPLT